ncbi:hypothetical protein [Sphingopyxis sp.]|uniref:hypothetical protein n=1 Tax=Sphingopyxis sp. TaxID=1908224 RepID=UPI001E068A33|nr:hypothetical protein [Sphingopyxis sp.]MBW8296382.1 hypothetical protein [Sphingopyxis sp.]
MDITAATPTAPDGIEEPLAQSRFWDRHASPISFIVLGGLLVAAVAGVFGGQPSPRVEADFGAATMRVQMPTVIRNGEFLETLIEIRANTAVEDATLAIETDLWRDITINTMIPAATEETFKNGEYRFAYGPLAEGEALRVKIDGQINPPLFGGNAGFIALYDGERLVGRRQFRIKVHP